MRELPRETRHERGVRGCSAGIESCSRDRCSSQKGSVARKAAGATWAVCAESRLYSFSWKLLFISTLLGLTCPGLLAPDRRDAGSRRVGSRVHGRSEDRGYVVPQASDVSVAGDARWGSRPMAEHRVMSEDHLGLTHYRSRRCNDSQAG